MATFPAPLDFTPDAALIRNSPLSWIANNSSKPGRTKHPNCWVLQSNPDWSGHNFQRSSEWVAGALLSELGTSLGRQPVRAAHSVAHRWRYAVPSQPLSGGQVFDAGLRIGLCGDWCEGSRLESAFRSGLAMAGRILGAHRTGKPPTP